VSSTARLEYRVDSLMNEVRRRDQQIDALASENRDLTARNTELETRMSEMALAMPEPSTTTPSPAPSTGNSGYEGALSAFRGRDFSGAIQQFESLINSGVGDDLADNCHYWIGESYYGMGRYSDAINHFRMVLKYAKSEKKDDSQLMIGNACLAMGDKAAARDEYNKLISSYPASPLADKAREKLSRLN
jgi:tol-pal system protein YbgF